MGNYKYQIVRTLNTGNTQVDNYDSNVVNNYRTYDLDFDFISGKNSNLILQFEAEQFIEENQNYYIAKINFDIDLLNALLDNTFVLFFIDDGITKTEIRVGEINNPTSLFASYLLFRIPGSYGVTYTSFSAADVFFSTIISKLNLIYPNFNFKHSPGDSFIQVEGKFFNTFFKLTYDIPIIYVDYFFITDEVFSQDKYYDELVIAELGDFNITLDVIKNDESLILADTDDYITTLAKSYDESHSYLFNLKEIINSVYESRPINNFISFYENLRTLKIQVNQETERVKYPEEYQYVFKILDGKIDNNSAIDFFDYIYLSKPITEIIPPGNAKYRFRIYVDLTKFTYNPSLETLIEYSNGYETFQLNVTDTVVNDYDINFNQNIISILSDISGYLNSYFYDKLTPYDSGVILNANTENLDNTFGYVECEIITSDTALCDFSMVSPTYLENLCYVVLAGARDGNLSLLNNFTKEQVDENIDYKTIKFLNNYKLLKSQYYQDNYNTGWDSDLNEKCNEQINLDILVNQNGSLYSSAFLSILTYYRGVFNEDLYNTTLKISRLKCNYENGMSNYINLTDEGQELFNIDVINKIILESDTFRKTNGVLHFNMSDILNNYDILNLDNFTYFPSGNSIKITSVEFNIDLLIFVDSAKSLAYSNPVKINYNYVNKGDYINDFIYRNSLGGVSSFTFVQEPKEVIKNETELVRNSNKIRKSSKYNDGDVDVNLTYDTYNVNYNEFTVEKNINNVEYTLTYATNIKEDYFSFKDMLNSDKIYYRLRNNNNVNYDNYTEVLTSIEYEYNDGLDYTITLKMKFLNNENNYINLNNFNRV